MADRPPGRSAGARNLLVAGVCLGACVAMTGLAFAAVPLYRAFCQATGFDGTPRRALANRAAKPLARTIQLRFDARVRGLPWVFEPAANAQTVRVGATSLAYFRVKNLADRPLTGRAVYNLAPEAAAAYFLKLQCFCFDDQTLPARAEKTFPVVFYVDPKFASDPDTSELQELVLSYTFFPTKPLRRPGGTVGRTAPFS